ncbi:hypothetical protein [Nocardiopsis nanhaiensis]
MMERLPPGPDLITRLQLDALRHPRRGAIYRGVLSGTFFGLFMGMYWLFRGEVQLLGAVVAAVLMGLFFGLVMGFSSRFGAGVEQQFPIGTDPQQARAASELLLLGRLGDDPETNELARQQAETVLASRMSQLILVPLVLLFWLAICGAAVWTYLDQGVDFPFVFLALLSVLIPFSLAVSVPWGIRYRRRVRAFLSTARNQEGSG